MRRDQYRDHACVTITQPLSYSLDPRGDDPRIFHVLPQPESCMDSYYILATAEQASRLHDEYGLDIGVD